MRIGVPLSSKNCFEVTPALPRAIRVPSPAAGMITITFDIRDRKYSSAQGASSNYRRAKSRSFLHFGTERDRDLKTVYSCSVVPEPLDDEAAGMAGELGGVLVVPFAAGNDGCGLFFRKS